jgi:hypothetical protein
MANTVYPSPSIVYDPSKIPSKVNVIYQQPSAAGSSLNNTNTSNKIQYQSQMGSRNNAASTQPSINLQLSEISTYKIWSILNIIFCCSCVGCVACWYSTETGRFKEQRNIRAALKASKKSRNLNIVATILGIVFISILIWYNFSR